MRALIDADVLRYEIGHCSQNEDGPLPFDIAAEYLDNKIAEILRAVDCNSPVLYLTDGGNFRDEIAVTKPYKGNRKSEKPFHFRNITAYMRNQYEVREVDGLEADDLMSLDQLAGGGDTCICTRDKDLLMIPGWHYGWECGRQLERRLHEVTYEGRLWQDSNGKYRGEGLSFFYFQMLTGDSVDNIPGCPGVGPVNAFKLLEGKSLSEMWDIVRKTYSSKDSTDIMLEQGRLLWMTRELNEDGTPVLWNPPD